MRQLNEAYIGGTFVPVSGNDVIESYNPTNGQLLATARTAHRDDARRAIAAASAAQPQLARTTKAQRIEMLQALHSAVMANTQQICDTTIEEYGGPLARSRWVSQYASQSFLNAARVLEAYPLQQQIGDATVFMEPVGVSALIAPWNSTAGTLCSKLAYAVAAGCASVLKPSEFTPLQNRVVAEALHAAGLPAGVFNIVSGRGEDVGEELSTHPDIAKISFTGSTAVGKKIARMAMDSCKRISLGLSGKSASVILDDADLAVALPLALNAAFMNNGQACVAGSRLLIPASQSEEITDRIRLLVDDMRTGDPADPRTLIGPLFSRDQYQRVQQFIRRGLQQGATLLCGGEGHPPGLSQGYFVRPTVFTDVSNQMDIAREEIFGPLLSVITYENEEEAITLANDSVYGLQAYVFGSDVQRASAFAQHMQAGSVLINRITPELMAPFGGIRQSGIGREFGIFGLESYLEPKTLVGDLSLRV